MFLGLLIGIIGGVAGGMGMGGGTLLIPLLTIFLAVPQKEAQTISLVAFVCMAGFAIFIHFKNKLVDFKAGTILAVFGCIIAVIMAFVAQNASNEVLKILFGVFLIVLSAFEFFGIYKNFRKKKKEPGFKERYNTDKNHKHKK